MLRFVAVPVILFYFLVNMWMFLLSTDSGDQVPLAAGLAPWMQPRKEDPNHPTEIVHTKRNCPYRMCKRAYSYLTDHAIFNLLTGE